MDAELVVRNIAAHEVQAGVLVASAFRALRFLSFTDPRARLAALHATLLAVVLLPLMQPWSVVEPALEMTSSTVVITGDATGAPEAVQDAIGAVSQFDPSIAIVTLVMAGTCARLLWLFYGIIRLSRFSRAASAIPAPALASELEAELAVSARYIQQTGGRGPWTFGLFRPAVALPAGFDSLVPAFQRAVIRHELLHVKRRDIAIAFCEELAVAALWFHPWIWLLRARIRVSREQVVDSQVVALLDNRDEYVRCLVDHGERGRRCLDGWGRQRTSGAARLGLQGRAWFEVLEGHRYGWP